MLKRLWPRSLVGQLLLATAMALALAQLVNLGLLVRGQQREHVTALAVTAATRIADAQDRIDTATAASLVDGQQRPVNVILRCLDDAVVRNSDDDEDDRADHGRRDRRALRMRLVRAECPDFLPDSVEWPLLAQRVSDVLGNASVRVRQVRAQQMPPPMARDDDDDHVRRRNDDFMRPRPMAVSVAAQLPDNSWITVRLNRPPREAMVAPLLLGQTLILFGLLLVPISWMALRITRPLRALSKATQETIIGAAAPVPESGPEDVRSLTRSFNAMRDRIAAMLTDKDRTLGAIGHDLRTPLASLRVRLEQVDNDVLREKMIGTVEEMAAMLDDIVALARVGQPRSPQETGRLGDVVRAIADDYQAMARPVSIISAPIIDEPMVQLRTGPIRRAIRNLIDNALAYGHMARLSVTADAGHVRLFVDDDGPGIAPDKIADMMEPFTRADESRNRETGGAGLGLALAKAIVVGEGGTLSLSNRPEGGLRAEISLPKSSAE